MAHVRKTPEARKAELLAAAVEIAKAGGVLAVTRAAVGAKVGVTAALINRYFDGRNGLRWETICEAGAQKLVAVMASALNAGYELKDLEGASSKTLMQQARKMAEA